MITEGMEVVDSEFLKPEDGGGLLAARARRVGEPVAEVGVGEGEGMFILAPIGLNSAGDAGR